MGKFYLIIESCQSLHICPPAQTAGVDKVLYSAFQGSERGTGAIVTDTGIGIISVHTEGQFFFCALTGYLFIVQSDGHG